MKQITTDKGKTYPCVFCAAVSDGVLMEVQDYATGEGRSLTTIGGEFEDVESIQYEYPEADIGRTFNGPYKLTLIQFIDTKVVQIKLTTVK